MGKIFGIGLSRTGTTSLTAALKILRVQAIHWPQSMGDIARHEASTDITVSLMFEELDRKYPGSKFIYTIRERDPWLASCEKHIKKTRELMARLPPQRWLVNIDEDAFLLSLDGLAGILEHMDAGGFHACGMPDGGVIKSRPADPVVPNAFFNVFDADFLRRTSPQECPYDRSFEDSFPKGMLKPDCRHSFGMSGEPYYPFFYGLLDRGARFLYLDAKDCDNGATMLMDHKGSPLVLHAWFSRHYEDAGNRARIDAVYDSAKLARAHPAMGATGHELSGQATRKPKRRSADGSRTIPGA